MGDVGGNNPQVLAVPWPFLIMAVLGCRLVQSRGSRGGTQSCRFSSLPFSFSSSGLAPIELSPCCSLGLKSEVVRTVGGLQGLPHGRGLPQFENVAASLPAWVGVRETIQVDASLKVDTSLYSLHSRMRKEGHAWHLSWDFPGRRAELSVTASPGERRLSVPAGPAAHSVSCCRALPAFPTYPLLPPLSLPLALRVKGVTIQCGPGPLRLLRGYYFLSLETCGCLPKEAWTGVKPETNKPVKV